MHTAPVPGTVDDFWQMIWDQSIYMVVMLTTTMEGGKVCAHTCHAHYSWTQSGNLQTLQRKSEDYYSESPGDTFSSGRFQVRTISLKYHVDYEVRVLEVVQVRSSCSGLSLYVRSLAEDLNSTYIIIYMLSLCRPAIHHRLVLWITTSSLAGQTIVSQSTPPP